MPRKVDITVIGAGVHGASLAFNLLALEAGSVLMVDKGSVGSGATGRSASFIRHHYSNEICVDLVKVSRRILLNFEKEVGKPVDFEKRPLLLLAGEEHAKALRENVAMHRRLGVRVDLLNPEEVEGRHPYLNLEGIVHAAIERDAGYSDAYQVNSAYVSRFREMGGQLLTDTKVESILVSSGRVRGVATDQGEVVCRVAVLATGPWSGVLAATAGLELPVEPALLSLGVLRPPRDLAGTPMAFDMTSGTYWRAEKGGSLLVGTDEEVGGSWDPDDLPDGVSFEFVTSISRRLARRWPEMRDARFLRGWVGVDGATPDMHPIIGKAPGIEGLYLSTGFSGHGFKFSPAVGRCLAELIVEGRYRTLDLSPFGLERFSQGRLFRSRYPMAVVQ